MLQINFIFLFLTFSLIAWGKSSLPELQSKQSVDNIRFITEEGRYTYFQKKSGGLFLSSNYETREILSNPAGTIYNCYASPDNKKLLIEVSKTYHTNYRMRQLKEIYETNIGETVAKKIADGISPKLHLADKWISYFLPEKMELIFQPIDLPENKISIKLNNTLNPYFTPEVVMLDPSNVLYTDINNAGFSAVIHNNFARKTSNAIYKSKVMAKRLELCKEGNNIYFGEFPFVPPTKIYQDTSSISQLKADSQFNFQIEVLYTSANLDLGNMICNLSEKKDKSIYFIQAQSKSLANNVTITEVASLNPKTKKISVISDLKSVNQISPMDDKLLIPHNGKVYVAVGESNLKLDALKQEKKN